MSNVRLIALTGQMGSGKSTVTRILQEHSLDDCEVVKFAGPLYEMQEAIYDIINRPIPQPKDRKLLQWLGTEWGRSIDQELWVKLFKERTQELWDLDTNVLNDDCRFNNEAEAVKAMGGKIVLIESTPEIRGQRIQLQNTGHPSEAGIDVKYLDYVLTNNGSLEDLEKQVLGMLHLFGLLV